ncbi:hypothetical protein C0Q70_13875 [Pomacea canaliculata]|uniref:C2H2-type domain-containing protein n=2 Tax=Pomacea canaliculata TaxID=400727 RepID=A0A2T7NYH0_POMCA|nr:hypothetical protein C0Q70_13875 [Pomacea canaliculata]
MDNYVSLKPVRLEDFRCSYNHSYPTPVQLVQHLYQLDQQLNYAGGTFSQWLNLHSQSAKNQSDAKEAFPVPDWQLTSESSEDSETAFPWLQSPTQPVPHIPSDSEGIHMDWSEGEETNISPSSPSPSEEAEAGDQNNEESQKPKGKKVKRIHTCDVCRKSYRLQASLEKHLRVPCELRPYKCDICSKAFKRPDHLKAHCRMHTGERPFLCDLCGKSFRQKNHLQRHSERKHVHGKEDDEPEEPEPEQDSSFNICGLSEELEDDEIRTDHRD